MANNRFSSRRTRHIDVKHHFIRDAIDSGIIRVEYINSGEQHADILTKALDAKTFERHARFLMNGSQDSENPESLHCSTSKIVEQAGVLRNT